MEVTEVLVQQHRETGMLLERFQLASNIGGRANVVGKVILDLRLHTAIEEELFYPAVREMSGEFEERVLNDLEQHHLMELLLDELEPMDPGHLRYVPKFRKLKELFLHHVEEVEREQFPTVRAEFGAQRLEDLANKVLRRREDLEREWQGEQLAKEELYLRAKALGVEGYAQMTTRQLVKAVFHGRHGRPNDATGSVGVQGLGDVRAPQ